MPTSAFSHINAFCKYLTITRPQSFLDIGLGNGKFGFIARDNLDVMLGENYRKEDWKVRIDGIEIFEDYIQDHQKAIYDNIYIGDAFDVIDSLGKYDMVFIGDVLEHFTKNRALLMLDKCMEHSTKHIILAIPLGEKWVQPEIYGNPHEEHKSFWTLDEFKIFSCEAEIHTFENVGLYGIFLIKKDDYLHHRTREKADALFLEGKKEKAISSLTNELKTLHPDLTSEYLLVDLLVKENRGEEAVERLSRACGLFPEEELLKDHLTKLKKAFPLTL